MRVFKCIDNVEETIKQAKGAFNERRRYNFNYKALFPYKKRSRERSRG